MAPALAPDAKIPVSCLHLKQALPLTSFFEQCPTPQHLHAELEALTWALDPEEKEDTWEKFEKAIIRFSAVTRGGGYKHVEMYVEGVGRKGIGTKLAKCMLSDRGRLSGVSTDLLQTFAPRLANNFKPLVSLYLECLVELLGRPNKVFLKRAEKCLLTIISHCQIATIITELKRGLTDNAATCRRGCAIGIERAVRDWPMDVWTERFVVQLEESVKKMATDKDPETRQIGKRVWASYTDLWPERVDDFSAPLTPTIRRYLDIPSANGAGPSKPKAVTRAAAAPPRPISAASSTSSLGTAAAQRPQHHRVQALASRALRTMPTQPQPTHLEAGPSRSQSPRKEPEHIPELAEEEVEGPEELPPALSRSTSGSSRPMDPPAPGILSRHGRSVSHNILPSASSSSLADSAFDKHNPLSNPSRPALHNSLSTTSLPTDPSRAPPPRRFAPPARIVRLIPASDEEGGSDYMIGDQPFTTPSGNTVLRGAVRPPIGRGRTQPALGHAQRRVVTAPAAISEDTTVYKTPGLGGRAYSQRRLAEEQDHKLAEAEEEEEVTVHDEEDSSGPSAAIAERFSSPAPAQAAHVDSPLLPVLIRPSSGEDLQAVHNNEQSEGIIDMEANAYPAFSVGQQMSIQEHKEVVEIAAAIELPLSPPKVLQEVKEVKEEESTASEVDDQNSALQTVEAAKAPADVLHAEMTAHDNGCAEAKRPSEEQAESTTSQPHLQTKSCPVKSSVPLSRSSPAKPAIAVNQETAHRTQAPAAKPKAAPIPAPTRPSRKPPVPLASGRTTRTVSAPISRKPFKPTSLTAPTAASAARAAPPVAASSSHPAPAPAVVSKSTVATSTSTAAAAAKPSAPVLPRHPPAAAKTIYPKPEEKVATKPPIPPGVATRQAQPRVVSGTRKPTVAVQVPLPAVKKEKIRLKAPLPSFRPTRTVGTTTAPTASTTLASSTTSTSSGRARVTTENIKLPESPVKPSEVALPPSPCEVPIRATPNEKIGSLPTSKRNSVDKPSPLKLELARGRASSTAASVPQSPITVAPPRPVSPLLTTAESDSVKLPGAPIFQDVSSPKSRRDGLNDHGLPADDPFASQSVRIQFSKASTVPALSPGRDTLESEDEDDESAMAGVTFKLRTSPAKALHSAETTAEQEEDTVTKKGMSSEASAPQVVVKSNVNAFAPRSDVSTPSKTAAMLLAKLDGAVVGRDMPTTTPGERKVLSVKDANTPGWFDADVSA